MCSALGHLHTYCATNLQDWTKQRPIGSLHSEPYSFSLLGFLACWVAIECKYPDYPTSLLDAAVHVNYLNHIL